MKIIKKKNKHKIFICSVLCLSTLCLSNCYEVNAYSCDSFLKNNLEGMHNFSYSQTLLNKEHVLDWSHYRCNMMKGEIFQSDGKISLKALENVSDIPVSNKWACGFFYLAENQIGNLEENQLYRWSIRVKANREILMNSIGIEQGMVHDQIKLTDVWQTISNSFVATHSDTSLNFVFYSAHYELNDVIEIADIELVKVENMF